MHNFGNNLGGSGSVPPQWIPAGNATISGYPTTSGEDKVLELDALSGQLNQIYSEVELAVGDMRGLLDSILGGGLGNVGGPSGNNPPAMGRVGGLKQQAEAILEQVTQIKTQILRLKSL